MPQIRGSTQLIKLLTRKIHHLFKELLAKQEFEDVFGKIQLTVDELIDATANAVDAGSSIITQLRTLGALADNNQRPAEVLESCLLIEDVMLNMSTDWEMIESLWLEEREKAQNVHNEPSNAVSKPEKLGTQLNAQEAFLRSARKRLQKDLSETQALLQETKVQQEVLCGLANKIRQNANQSPLAIKAQQLEEAYKNFIFELQSGNRLINHVEQFLKNADSILHQFDQMKHDLQNASAAVAGELGPLAKQKASSVIADGEQLLQNSKLAENRQHVADKLVALRQKIEELNALARQRIEGNTRLFEQMQLLAKWLREHAEPFLANNGNLGANNNTAQDFLQTHWQFATDLINKESSVNSVLINAHELNDEGKEQAKFMYNSWQNIKQMLEIRIKLANIFRNIHKFGTELDRSFDSIATLLDQNNNLCDDTTAKQINNSFYSIQSTLAQEKHQAEKFLSTAKAAAQNDLHLNSDQASDNIVAMSGAHELKFQELQRKWQDWQDRRKAIRTALQTVEEVQMWQTETSQLVGRLKQQAKNGQAHEDIYHTVKTLPVQEQSQRLDNAYQTIRTMQQNEQALKRCDNVKEQQERLASEIEKLMQHRVVEEFQQNEQVMSTTVNQQATSPHFQETVHHQVQQPPSSPNSRPPHLMSPLNDVIVEKGQPFEFKVQIDGSPEPKIEWAKDGRAIRNNPDYHLSYQNGFATLTIEETVVEDTAVYTLRAHNSFGSAQSSARLTVKPRNQSGHATETTEGKPRFVRQLQNVIAEEGASTQLDCVIVAKPEPQVIWYREEEVIRESERIRLEYTGDQCTLAIQDSQPQDSGLYKPLETHFDYNYKPTPLPRNKSLKVKAQNVYGETINFCRLHVNPRPSQPLILSQQTKSTIHEPPNFQPSLMNQVVREGEPATIQVCVVGKPTPQIAWTKDDRPIQESDNVRVTQEADGWTRIHIKHVRPENVGLYMITAINKSGEARTGATLNAIPAHVLQAGTTTQQHHFNRGSGIDLTLEHNVQIQQQHEPHQITTNYAQQSPLNQQRTIQHQIVHEAASMHPLTNEVSDFGFSSLANAPQFIRPFAAEYTVNEGEKAKLDCLMVGNPRPKVQWFFNDHPIKSNWQFAEFPNIGDTYFIEFSPAKLENAGYYRMVAENIRGKTESMTVIHVRPRSIIPQPAPVQRVSRSQQPQGVQDFGATDYGFKHQLHSPIRNTSPPQKRYASGQQQQMTMSAYQPRGDVYKSADFEGSRQDAGHPPHFIQTLNSCVAITGDMTRFDAVVTGLPQPDIKWSKDGNNISPQTHPQIDFLSQNGRVSLVFKNAQPSDSGKYMCTATNASGVATSSAQFVVRPKTMAPDFAQRLISEELSEGDELKWTVQVTGEPEPKVTWLRNGQPIPNCNEVQIISKGNGVHLLIIGRVEPADGGQFTCVAENLAGEARSTADLVIRPLGTEPGNYFHVTKVTQEKQVRGEEVTRNQTFSIETPRNQAFSAEGSHNVPT